MHDRVRMKGLYEAGVVLTLLAIGSATLLGALSGLTLEEWPASFSELVGAGAFVIDAAELYWALGLTASVLQLVSWQHDRPGWGRLGIARHLVISVSYLLMVLVGTGVFQTLWVIHFVMLALFLTVQPVTHLVMMCRDPESFPKDILSLVLSLATLITSAAFLVCFILSFVNPLHTSWSIASFVLQIVAVVLVQVNGLF